MDFDADSKTLTVFQNGNISKKAEIQYFKSLTISDIITNCRDSLSLDRHKKCRLLDLRGEELSDDDLEYINSAEPLFISQGEKFIKNSTMAIFKEIKKLGQGGFGSVSLYKNKITKQEVAIKFIDLTRIMSPEDVNRLFSEVSILRGLHHRNIVDLIDVFDIESKSCFVMEYCSGGELKNHILQNSPLSEAEVYKIALQIVEAIRYCHNSGIVHRDLKLENILFSKPNKKLVKIVDFGISGNFSLSNSMNADRSDAGSLHYIAPEILNRSNNRANPALDVWSLGCIFYAMLTGNLPFTGSRREIINKIIECSYPPLPEGISRPWHKLIKGMLRKLPEARWTILKISDHLIKFKDLGNVEVSDDSFEAKLKITAARSNGFIKIRNERRRTPDTRNS